MKKHTKPNFIDKKLWFINLIFLGVLISGIVLEFISFDATKDISIFNLQQPSIADFMLTVPLIYYFYETRSIFIKHKYEYPKLSEVATDIKKGGDDEQNI